MNPRNFNELKINLSGALLFAFLSLSFVGEANNRIEIVLVIVTVILLLLSLISNSWAKFRLAHRKVLFNDELKKFADSTLKPTLEQADIYFEGFYKKNYQILIEQFTKDHIDLIKDKSKDEIKFYLDLYIDTKKDESDKHEGKSQFINALTTGLSGQFEEVHDRCFNEALSTERYATVKYHLEIFSRKFGVYFFISGVMSFMITTVLLLI